MEVMPTPRWFHPPVSDDPEQQLRARVIHQLLAMVVVTILPLTILIPVVEEDYTYSFPLYLSALVVSAVSFVVLHAGYVRTAGGVVMIAGWGLTLWASFASGGSASPQASMAVLVLILAGILWSATAAVGMAVALVASLAGIELLNERGFLPEPFIETTRFTAWAAISSVLALSAVALQIFVRAINSAREDAANKTLLLQQEMERRAATEASLRRSQKLEALGRLTGGIAHDFNNILTVLVAESELLEESTNPGRALSEEEQTQIRAIRASADRASELTGQLLAFSRLQAGVPEVVSPDASIQKLEPMLERLIREDVRLEVTTNAPGACVRIDPSQLDQVVMNLVLNSSDAMPRGGSLEIQTARWEGDPVTLQVDPEARPAPAVVIRVRDTGQGIESDDLERIFDPFFTTKGVGRGTGLGLATAHGIVSQAGGDIRVEASGETGTTFEILLPEVPQAEVAISEPKTRVSGKTTAARILLCEDDEAVRRSTRRILMTEGHSVHGVASGEEALEWLQDGANELELLVSDVILPGMNGAELSHAAVEVRPDLRVLLVSGYTANVLKESGVPPEVELLEKPFKPDVLLARVASLLRV